MGDGNLILELDNQADLTVRQITAHEYIGQPYQLDVICMSQLVSRGRATSGGGGDTGPRVDIDAIIGQRAAVRVQQDKGTHRVWSGVVSFVELVRWDVAPGSESTYHVRVVPTYWLLTQRRGNRIYQHVKIPDVLKKLLAEWELDVSFRHDDGKYVKHEYIVQYGETDFAFAQRLMEEAGLSYWFEADQSGGEAKTILVIGDDAHSQEPAIDLPFAETPNEVHNPIYATNVALSHRVRPGRVQLSDFNFRRPGHPLFGTSEVAEGAEGTREHYAYEPGGFLVETGGPQQGLNDEKVADDKSTTVHDAEGEGRAKAERYLEALRRDKRVVAFETSAQSLVPAKCLTISDHPHGELDGQRLLAHATMTRVTASGEWTVVAEAVFTDQPYRLPRVTPKATVRGVQSGIVVGPKGDEIYCDEFGRIRVKLHWDREGQFDDNSTCWLRVSQAWAGAQYGTQMIPRVGHEVIVDFLDGDPDQPLVVGRLYTHPSPAPYKLPDHATRSTWQSNTTPDQKGEKAFNEIMFEDKKGEELVLLQAQRNMMGLTKRNHTERIGKKRSHVVGRDWVHVVADVDAHQVGKEHLAQMVKVSDLNVLDKKEPGYSKKKTFFQVKKDKITLTTGKSSIVLDGANITIQADKGIRMSADRNLVVAGGPMVFINAMPGASVNPKASWKIKDEVPEPEGAILNSIVQLFHSKWKAKKRQGKGEREIRARIDKASQDFVFDTRDTSPPNPYRDDEPEQKVKAKKPDGSEYENLFIEGGPEFVAATQADVDRLNETEHGKALLESVDENVANVPVKTDEEIEAEVESISKMLPEGPFKEDAIEDSRRQLLEDREAKSQVTIKPAPTPSCNPADMRAGKRKDQGGTGLGSGSVIEHNPQLHTVLPDGESDPAFAFPQDDQPASVLLGHEMIHADRNAKGLSADNPIPDEMELIGIEGHTNEALEAGGKAVTENTLREQLWGKSFPKRTEY